MKKKKVRKNVNFLMKKLIYLLRAIKFWLPMVSQILEETLNFSKSSMETKLKFSDILSKKFLRSVRKIRDILNLPLLTLLLPDLHLEVALALIQEIMVPSLITIKVIALDTIWANLDKDFSLPLNNAKDSWIINALLLLLILLPFLVNHTLNHLLIWSKIK